MEDEIELNLAKSGSECLMLATGKKYDIIFLDHMMPEMNGLEILKKLLCRGNRLEDKLYVFDPRGICQANYVGLTYYSRE